MDVDATGTPAGRALRTTRNRRPFGVPAIGRRGPRPSRTRAYPGRPPDETRRGGADDRPAPHRTGPGPPARPAAHRPGSFAVGERLDVERHRGTLESILEVSLEDVVRFPGRVVHAWGAFSFSVRGERISGDWSLPSLSLTGPTLDAMDDVRSDAERVVTVENRAPFESHVLRERPDRSVVMYTGGFAGSRERSFLDRMFEAGVDTVRHWGDLDVGGLRILRHLDETLDAEVRPFRMEPEQLEQFPTRPLTDRDRRHLRQWLGEDDPPFERLARGLLESGRKAEQEAWFVVE